MDGLKIMKEAWKPADDDGSRQTFCQFDDPDVCLMRIGFQYNAIEVRREDFPSVEQMKLRIETIERLMQKAFNQGRNHQAALIQGALNPNARPTH